VDNKFGELAIARRLLLRTRDAGTLALEKRSTCATQHTDFALASSDFHVHSKSPCYSVSALLQCTLRRYSAFSAALQYPLCCYSTFLRRCSTSALLQYLCGATVHFCVATVTSVFFRRGSAPCGCAGMPCECAVSTIREF
jgi:hypothetical protein